MDSQYEFGLHDGKPKKSGVSLLTFLIGLLTFGAVVVAVGLFQFALNATWINNLQSNVTELQSTLTLLQDRIEVSMKTLSLNDELLRQQENRLASALQRVQIAESPVCEIECHNSGSPNFDCTSCECVGAWSGAYCQLPPKCDHLDKEVVCKNAGKFNMDTCLCECPPGLSGEYCTDIISDVTEDELVNFLTSLLGAKESEDEAKRSVAGPAFIPSSVGWGRSALVGKKTIPLLAFDDSNEIVNGKYKIPGGAVYTPIPAGLDSPDITTKAFKSYSDYYQTLLAASRNSPMHPTSFLSNQPPPAIFKDYFTNGQSLGSTLIEYPLYSLHLKNALSAYKLTSSFQQSIDYVSGFKYPENKKLFNSFFDQVGVNVVTKSVAGGAVESVVTFNGAAWEAKLGAGVPINSWIRNQIEIVWSSQTSNGAWQKNDPQFTQQKVAFFQTCRGGESARIDCGSQKNLDNWKKTLWNLPVPIVDSFVPIIDLVKNAETRALLRTALTGYLTEKQAEAKH